jgi:hypothetical protein
MNGRLRSLITQNAPGITRPIPGNQLVCSQHFALKNQPHEKFMFPFSLSSPDSLGIKTGIGTLELDFVG